MSWWLKAKAGDRIVCIRECQSRRETNLSRIRWLFWRRHRPRKGKVYTLGGFLAGDFFWTESGEPVPAIVLRGFDPRLSFKATAFRPVHKNRRRKATREAMRQLRKLLETRPARAPKRDTPNKETIE
jgi:hypothetical protein